MHKSSLLTNIFRLKSLIKKSFSKETPLDDRLLRIASLGVWIFMIPIIIGITFLDLPVEITYFVVPCFTTFTAIYFYTLYKPITNFLKRLIAVLGMLIMVPCWYYVGGMEGNISYYFFPLAIIAMFVLWSTNYSWFAIIMYVEILILIGIEYFTPIELEYTENTESKVLFRYVSILFAFLLSGWLASVYHTAFRRGQKRIIKAKEELQLAKLKAEKDSLAKSEFLAKMSHELRTPLNTIIGGSELLKSNHLNAEQNEILTLMNDSGNLLLNLISDILDLSKIEANKFELLNEEIDLQKFLRSIRNFAEYQIKESEKEIVLSTNFKDNLPETILVDSFRLKQILTNLISNAVKYTKNGQIIIEVHYSDKGERPKNLEFVVKDTGIGIDKSQLEFIMEPFNQITVHKDNFEGVGLGLAICKSLAGLMGGKLVAENRKKQGSKFTFSLPAIVVENNRHEIQKNIESFKDFGNYKMLLADDNKMNQIIMKKLLQKLNAEVDIAGNGQEAYEMAKSSNYDLIFMDLQMPVLSGLEASKCIMNDDSILEKPKIIASTAHAMEEEKIECLQAGMVDFISKPVTLEKLKLVVLKNMALKLSESED